MLNILTSLSRITIIVYVLAFTLCDIVLLFENALKEATISTLGLIQRVLVVFFLVNCSYILYLATEDYRILFLCAGQLLLFLVFSLFLNRLRSVSAPALTANIFMLLSFSFIELERLNMPKAIRQYIFAFVSVIIGLIAICILKKLTNIKALSPTFLVIGISGLILVLLTGTVEYGAKLSLQFGSISIQPSEFIKLSFIFFISACIIKYKDYRGFLFSTLGAGAHVLILVLSRDLGSALIFALIYVFLIFVAYKNYLVLFVEIGGAIAAGIIAYRLFPHIRTRFIAWSDPLSVVEDQGYQISQSLFAIGSGGWFGSGLYKGQPTKIPVVAKDFIFASIAEEMGLIVAICLIVIVVCTFFIIFNAAYRCTDSYYMLVISGLAVMFAVQSFLNIGGVTKFIPSTGVTLPFISYGGSSLLASIVAVFVIEASEDISHAVTNKGYENERKKYK